MGWWSPDPRGVIPPGGPAGAPVAAQGPRPLRRAGRHRLRPRSCAAAPTPRARAAGSRRRSPTPTVACTSWAGRTASRPGRTASWSAGSTASRSAACSRGSRCSTRVRDASKVALVGLAERFHADGDPRRLVDVQWATDHLRSLGAQEWPREVYLDRLVEALRRTSGRAVGLTAVGAAAHRARPGTRSSRRPRTGSRCGPSSVPSAGTSDQAATSSASRSTVAPAGRSRAARASRMTGTGHRVPRASTTGGPPLTGRPSRAVGVPSRRRPGARGRAAPRRRPASARPPRAAG